MHGQLLYGDALCDEETPHSHLGILVLIVVKFVVVLLAGFVAVIDFVVGFLITFYFSLLVRNLECPQHQRT